MNLQNFVADTLFQITQGIADAQKKISEAKIGATVNPEPMNWGDAQKGGKHLLSQGRLIQEVDFDVALAVESTGNSEAKVAVLAGFLGGKVGAGTESSEGKTHRIKFSVPIRLPG